MSGVGLKQVHATATREKEARVASVLVSSTTSGWATDTGGGGVTTR